jgi:hypothetical protein
VGLPQEDIFLTVMQTLTESDEASFDKHYARMLLNMMSMGMDAQVDEWHNMVKDKFAGEDLGEKLLEELGLHRRVELLNYLMANQSEDNTPYFNDLLQSVNRQLNRLSAQGRFHLREIETACQQKGFEFKPDYNEKIYHK